jgi:cation diffusion facilitator family transporter
LESVINLTTAFLLVFLLRIANLPPDDDHPYGHDKAEYFANGVQGTLILLAAVGIVGSAIQRFLEPQALQAGVEGLTVAAAAGLLNFLAARYLRLRGKKLRSQALVGEADHLMSDVWTTLAVLVGVGLSIWSNLLWLDPAAALLVSGVVFSTGWKLLRNFVSGMMDTSLPVKSQEAVVETLDRFKEREGLDYHALRSRVSGSRTFVSVHVLVPGAWSVSKGHRLLDEIEADVANSLEGKVTVLTHLEPLGEACSFADIDL